MAKESNKYYITIQPTNEVDDQGYHTGKVSICKKETAESKEEIIDSWLCDSYRISGDIMGDFEAENGLKLWAWYDKIKVSAGYTTRIIGKGAEDYSLYPSIEQYCKALKDENVICSI